MSELAKNCGLEIMKWVCCKEPYIMDETVPYPHLSEGGHGLWLHESNVDMKVWRPDHDFDQAFRVFGEIQDLLRDSAPKGTEKSRDLWVRGHLIRAGREVGISNVEWWQITPELICQACLFLSREIEDDKI